MKKFNKYSAKTKHEEWPENRLSIHAKYHFFSTHSHFLNQHTLYFRVGIMLFSLFNDLIKGLFYLIYALKPSHDPVGIGFVQNLWRENLHCHRARNAFSNLCCFTLSFRKLCRQYIKAVTFKQFNSIQFAKTGFP